MSELLKVFPDWRLGHKFAVYCVRFRMVSKFVSICRFVSAEWGDHHVRFYVAHMNLGIGEQLSSCFTGQLATSPALGGFRKDKKEMHFLWICLPARKRIGVWPDDGNEFGETVYFIWLRYDLAYILENSWSWSCIATSHWRWIGWNYNSLMTYFWDEYCGKLDYVPNIIINIL